MELRKTRFVCVSDTHNYTFKLPKGDVLIHAGDLTNQGTYAELSKTSQWIEEADFEAKVVVAGNHDITLDADFYENHGRDFHNCLQSIPDCLRLFEGSSSITYLYHDSKQIKLSSPDGPHTHFNIFGSPYSPRHGLWAFYYEPPPPPEPGRSLDDHHLTSLWDMIPVNTDIVVSHTPPRLHGDQTTDVGRPTGCEALRRALWRVRPQLSVCGHIHDGRGADVVTWTPPTSTSRYGETSCSRWVDPGEGNKKLSLVDMTGRNRSLFRADDSSFVEAQALDPTETLSRPFTDWARDAGPGERKQTCIVNAAIMKSKYPHAGGKEYNKPIVVDLMLPVWEDGD